MTGDKRYELSNHLGNVLVVINDKKIPEFEKVDTPESGLVAFNADVLSYSDYYPFGMLQEARHGSKANYRYGFQGQEMDNEIKGEGNSLNYTFRMHDPRVGRFFAVDPLSKDYPFYSPYQFSGNSPLIGVDMEGLELQVSNTTFTMKQNTGTAVLTAEADFNLKIKVLNLTGKNLIGTQQVFDFAKTRASNVYSDKTGTGNFEIIFGDKGQLLKRPINYKVNAKIDEFSVGFVNVNSIKDIKDGDLVLILADKTLKAGNEPNAYVNCPGCNVMIINIGAPEYNISKTAKEIDFNGQTSKAQRIGKTIVHEIGHFLGLIDQYISGAGPKKGYEKNVMADSTQSGITQAQIAEILNDVFFEIRLRKHNETKGLKDVEETKKQVQEVLKNENLTK
ncbi:RHS repeat-associated core domain-containing protein [Flavobacterium sp. WV_118_3]|uniref:RHS repeat domain-containing protein n=1 Tax=Flavobacterium sp. WV_118_3 TaxID=3151764 RepID=UPI00321C0DA0